MVISILAIFFCLFMLYASDIAYVAMSPLILTLGIPLFIFRKKQDVSGVVRLSKNEILGLAAIFCLDAFIIFIYFQGWIKFP